MSPPKERHASHAATLFDRFICRREGHKPTVVLFRGPVTTEPYMTTCQRCGKWFEAEPQVKP